MNPVDRKRISLVIGMATLPLACALLGGAPAHAQGDAARVQKWSITGIPTLGGTRINVSGINESGHVVGDSTLSDDVSTRAFLYKDGRMNELGTLSGQDSFASGINNAGTIVGTSGGRPFVYSKGNMAELKSDGHRLTSAAGINNSGQIISQGYAGPRWTSFTSRNGRYTDLGLANNYLNTVAWGINSRGQVVGHAFNRNDGQGFLYENGKMTVFGNNFWTVGLGLNDAGHAVGMTRVENSTYVQPFLYKDGKVSILWTPHGVDGGGQAMAINNAGQIVGGIHTNPDMIPVSRAFLYQDGVMTDLTELPEVKGAGWVLTHASVINNKGQIAGTGTLFGEPRAFLLSPVAGKR